MVVAVGRRLVRHDDLAGPRAEEEFLLAIELDGARVLRRLRRAAVVGSAVVVIVAALAVVVVGALAVVVVGALAVRRTVVVAAAHGGHVGLELVRDDLRLARGPARQRVRELHGGAGGDRLEALTVHRSLGRDVQARGAATAAELVDLRHAHGLHRDARVRCRVVISVLVLRLVARDEGETRRSGTGGENGEPASNGPAAADGDDRLALGLGRGRRLRS